MPLLVFRSDVATKQRLRARTHIGRAEIVESGSLLCRALARLTWLRALAPRHPRNGAGFRENESGQASSKRNWRDPGTGSQQICRLSATVPGCWSSSFLHTRTLPAMARSQGRHQHHPSDAAHLDGRQLRTTSHSALEECLQVSPLN